MRCHYFRFACIFFLIQLPILAASADSIAPLWVEEALAAQLACLGDPRDVALEFTGINASTAAHVESYSELFNAIGMSLFIFGEGPLDLTCSHPLASMAALAACPSLDAVSQGTDSTGVLGSLCSEGPTSMERRFQHCLSLVLGSGLTSVSRLVHSGRQVRHQFALCAYAARCTLPVLSQLCHDVVSIIARRNLFCTSRRLRHVLASRCNERWPGIVSSKWGQLVSRVAEDAVSDPGLFYRAVGILSHFGAKGGGGTDASIAVDEPSEMHRTLLEFGDDVRRVTVERGMLPALHRALLKNATLAARYASLTLDHEG